MPKYTDDEIEAYMKSAEGRYDADRWRVLEKEYGVTFGSPLLYQSSYVGISVRHADRCEPFYGVADLYVSKSGTVRDVHAALLAKATDYLVNSGSR